MRVCFVAPPRPWLVNPHAQAPIGILYLAAVLERAGHTVRVLNMAGRRLSNGVLYGRELTIGVGIEADVFCLTGTWLDVPKVNALASVIRRACKRARILVGGPIALQPDDIAEEVDVVVQGEAEADICALVNGGLTTKDTKDRKGSDPSHSASDPVPSASSPPSCPSCPSWLCSPPADLDALPFPARHLWAGPFGGNVFIGGENYFGGGSTTILSSRGCPYDCAFCASSALAPRKVRFRSPESVVEEMEQCVADFGVRQFRFSDENFNANADRVHALCDAIIESAILGAGEGIAWRASIAVHPVHPEMFEVMEAAGCKEVSIGVESADPKVLKTICPAKLKSPDDAIRALGMAKAADLKTRALMMVGTPGENPGTARLNAEFFKSITSIPSMRAPLCDALAVTVFTPMPGSDIYNHPDRYGCRIRTDRTTKGTKDTKDRNGSDPSRSASEPAPSSSEPVPSASEPGPSASSPPSCSSCPSWLSPRRSVCLYGPDGQHAIEPTIELDDFPLDALRESMAAQVAAAEATGKIGRG